MTNRARDLLNYVANCEKAGSLGHQIQELEQELSQLESCSQSHSDFEKVTDIILTELHNIRIKKLELELELNTVERKILQFELDQELAD